MSELKRILSARKRRIILIAVPILCFVLFFYTKCGGKWNALFDDARNYRDTLAKYDGKTSAEIVADIDRIEEELRYSLTQSTLSDAESRIREQAKHVGGYSAYIKGVGTQAKRQANSSLFGKDKNTFVYRNIQKTAKDFAALENVTTVMGNDRAIEDWLSFDIADILFAAAILIFVISFFDEKKNGLCAVVRGCPRGRIKLGVTRLVLLLCFSAVFTLLLYYLPLGVSFAIDGGTEGLGRPVQSLISMKKFTASLSVGGWLVMFFAVKTACGLFFGTLVWFLFGFLEHMQLWWLLSVAGGVAEYSLFAFIQPQSILSPFKYVNLFSYIYTFPLTCGYVNINFFGHPVGMRTLLMILLAVLAVLLSVAVLLIQAHRYPFGNRDVLGGIIGLWNRAVDVIRRRLTLFGFEGYKLLILSGAIVFVLAGVWLSGKLYFATGAYYTSEEYMCRQYISQVEGKIDQSTYDYAKKVKENLDKYTGDVSDFRAGLSMFEKRLDVLTARAEEGGYEAWILDPVKFMNIYGTKNNWAQRRNALVALAVLAFCLAPVFAMESTAGTRRLIMATGGGRRKLFFEKYALSFVVTAAVWATVYMRQFAFAASQLGDTVLSAPCRNLDFFVELPAWMSVRGGMLLYAFIALAAMLMPMHICLLVSAYTDGFERSALALTVVLLLPAAAFRLNVESVFPLTVLPYMADSHPIAATTGGRIGAAVWFAVSLAAAYLAYRKWTVPGKQ